MLDALKRVTAVAKGVTSRSPSEELQALIEAARQERVALEATLTQLEIRGGKVAQVGKTLESLEQKIGGAAARLEPLGTQLSQLDARGKQVDELDKKIAALTAATDAARQIVDKVLSPDSELQKHREAVQQLSSQALQAQATLETIRTERLALEDMRTELRQVQADVKQALEGTSTSRTELEQIRGVATQLTQDYTRMRDASREGHERAASAMDAVKEIEKKLGPLATIQELSKNTEERLVSLNALAEHVLVKSKAVENQKHAVERAVVEANRLNEMVWAMDVQIAKLAEGNKQGAKTEETLGRLEKLAQEMNGQLDAATAARDGFAREIVRVENIS
jgi:uncharacterized coiled-coil DUF342 family protein